MPWKVVGNRVYRADTGKPIKGGAHATHAQAVRHLRALYANVHHKAFEMHHSPKGIQKRGFRGRFTQMLRKRAALKKPISLLTVKAFNPSQKRWPKGSPQGGEWKSQVSGELFTGSRQREARRVIQAATQLHGSLPAHTVRISRRFGKGIEGEYGSGKIRVNARSPLASLETAHEIGHLFDDRGFATAFGSVSGGQFRSFRRAVDATPTVKKWRVWSALGHIALGGNRYFVGRNTFRYALNRREQFARAYAQYLARKVGGKLRRDLRIAQKSPVSYYWQDREFRGIERELDKLFNGRPRPD